jgi:hypothetical protein
MVYLLLYSEKLDISSMKNVHTQLFLFVTDTPSDQERKRFCFLLVIPSIHNSFPVFLKLPAGSLYVAFISAKITGSVVFVVNLIRTSSFLVCCVICFVLLSFSIIRSSSRLLSIHSRLRIFFPCLSIAFI